MFDSPEKLAWVVLFLPLVAAGIIGLGLHRRASVSALLSIGAVGVAFLASCILGWVYRGVEDGRLGTELAVTWLSVGTLRIDLGLRLDPLSIIMMLIVTGVGGVIHVYSYGYMHEDRSMGRFFGCLSLFTFSMLGIVLSNNLAQTFVFWELVGLSSYLLIGFWFERPAAADACKKAFLTNRIGDFGFLLGIIATWSLLGSVHFGELQLRLSQNPAALGSAATMVGLLLFCGAMGKSAQFPLHVWLPDAMEGPTPVSALIHAATMVAAGVFMLCRVYFLLDVPDSSALTVIAWVGGGTALLAAVIAVQQNDIKRILAYSTLSQLGYMVMAVGLQGPVAAMYHLSTHAFFKALLFLGAGSVIHGMHHEQNIWRMGGLRERMPVTYVTFAAGTLALMGLPPFSGFYSKDEVLAAAFHHHPILFVLAVGVALLTTFYMARLVLVAFWGSSRSEGADAAEESPAVMVWPLVLLTVPTVLAGFWGIDTFLGRQFGGADAGHAVGFIGRFFAPFNHAPMAALGGLAATLFGASLAWRWYGSVKFDPLPERLGWLARAMRERFYFDELYRGLIAATQETLAVVAAWCDRWIIAGLLVRGIHGTTELIGRALRLVQTGSLQTYGFLLVAGTALVLFLALR